MDGVFEETEKEREREKERRRRRRRRGNALLKTQVCAPQRVALLSHWAFFPAVEVSPPCSARFGALEWRI